MKQCFYDKPHLSKQNVDRLNVINSIIAEYQEQGYTLTLRQLYYQLVSRDIIPNKQAEYAKLSTLLKEGRMAGIVDWNAIEDRVRVPKLPYFCDGVYDALNDTARQYKRDRQLNQPVYVEVWSEKDALSGILYRETKQYGIRLMINRGYSSCSAMYDAYNRLSDAISEDKDCVILYLGDHDPSGLDMIRDIRDRLEEFGISYNLNVKHIALTTEQVKKHDPPPNPAKVTDPRANNYINEFGPVSWEVDALNPDILTKLLRSEIESIIDMDIFRNVLELESEEQEALTQLAKQYS